MSGSAPTSATTAGRVPRDGRRQRLRARIAWAALATDAAAFAAIGVFVDFDSLGTALGVTVMAVPMVAAIALFAWGVSESIAAQRFDAFGRDERVVVSWIVDADTWRERMASRKQGTALLPGKAPAGGFEIVVSDEGIYIGDRVFLLARPTWDIPVRIHEDWIELELPADSSTYLQLLPIGRDGRAAADKVVRHFRKPFEPAPKTAPRRGP